MIILAIDGASRRNGKPDCASTGAVFAYDTEKKMGSVATICEETGSTNQRGEINALLVALDIGSLLKSDLFIVTDSEFVFNTISKKWYDNWINKNWVINDWKTGLPTTVKNKDLWEEIAERMHYITDDIGLDVVIYHVKGHLLNTPATLKKHFKDPNGVTAMYSQLESLWEQYLVDTGHKYPLNSAMELFVKNHGFEPDIDIYKQLIICNTVADLSAGYYMDLSEQEKQ